MTETIAFSLSIINIGIMIFLIYRFSAKSYMERQLRNIDTEIQKFVREINRTTVAGLDLLTVKIEQLDEAVKLANQAQVNISSSEKQIPLQKLNEEMDKNNPNFQSYGGSPTNDDSNEKIPMKKSAYQQTISLLDQDINIDRIATQTGLSVEEILLLKELYQK